MDNNLVDKLLELAQKAAENAYVPYSGFPVGAALITKSGKIFCGCNVENASFGCTVCAERVAICKAVSEGHTDFLGILVYNSKQLPYPCGSCRQVLAEFSPNIHIAVANDTEVLQYGLDLLLPYSFELEP